jgi:hypothetical protein
MKSRSSRLKGRSIGSPSRVGLLDALLASQAPATGGQDGPGLSDVAFVRGPLSDERKDDDRATADSYAGGRGTATASRPGSVSGRAVPAAGAA